MLCKQAQLAAKAVQRSVVAVPAARPARRSAVRVAAQAKPVAAAASAALATLTAAAGAAHAAAPYEVAQVAAASDNRLSTIALLFVPAVGWVAFNIFSPLINQLGRMSEMKDDAAEDSAPAPKKRRAVVGPAAIGGAALLAAAAFSPEQAQAAAAEVAQLAAGSDNRFFAIAALFAPAILWVGFNIFSPLTNQLGRMSEMKDDAEDAVAAPKPKRR